MINPTIIIEPFNYPGHRHGDPSPVSAKAVRVVSLSQPITVICTPTGKRHTSGPEYSEPSSCSLASTELQSQFIDNLFLDKLTVLDEAHFTGYHLRGARFFNSTKAI